MVFRFIYKAQWRKLSCEREKADENEREEAKINVAIEENYLLVKQVFKPETWREALRINIDLRNKHTGITGISNLCANSKVSTQ